MFSLTIYLHTQVEYSLVCCSCESKHVMTEKLEMLVHKMEDVLGKEVRSSAKVSGVRGAKRAVVSAYFEATITATPS